MIRILTIVGARPQFIKASSISKIIADKFSDKIQEVILHTGQHYDHNMSSIFFEELNIPKPHYQFDIKGANADEQFASMLIDICSVLDKEKFDAILVYGDTNSTLAGALAGGKKNVKVIHIEAGLRSYNRSMPEEVNRVMTDHISSLLFCPTDTAIDNLKNEGISDEKKEGATVYKTGDIMYDSALNFSNLIQTNKSDYIEKFKIKKDYVLCTVHRDFNTDLPENLLKVFEAFERISEKHDLDIIIPLHPRTAKMIEQEKLSKVSKIIENSDYIKIIPPVSYPEMLFLEKNAKLIMTDSGGVQKEAYFFQKKCIVLRPETEWIEIVELGCAVLAFDNAYEISEKFNWLLMSKDHPFPPIFGNGRSAEFIVKKIVEYLS